MEQGKFQWVPNKLIYNEDSQGLRQVAWRGCIIAILRYTQTFFG